ncbi:hypothetical protein CDL12_28776 [Handroanthus impetiginosus]|uniref:RNase H type-1 domain-containing protein n=1 Tax=Handroanthus impetiginosus TaxID=429701 RepID=A0A2G9G0B0_9LAMI|nr:hypothetical protein CDL12_28776 [Handroanthus impetiginosus]
MEARDFALKFLNDYRRAQTGNTKRGRELMQPIWMPPDEGVIKINFDAALSKHNRKMGIGIIARNCEGVCAGLKCKEVVV